MNSCRCRYKVFNDSKKRNEMEIGMKYGERSVRIRYISARCLGLR